MVELLFALSILVLTLVALVDLAVTSSRMVAVSRERAAMLNASAGYLDRVQQMAFGDVGLSSSDPSGTLAAQVTTVGPYVVTVTPMVTWGRPGDTANHALKTVTLSVEAHLIQGGSPLAFSTSAIMSASGIVTASGQTTSPVVVAPDVGLTSIGGMAVSPAATPTVSGSSVSVVASAVCNAPGAQLQYIWIYDGNTLRATMSAGGAASQRSWTWDTTADREGQHFIAAHSSDSYGNVGLGTGVTVIVDNAAPTPVGSVSLAFPSGTTGNLWWTQATDGTDVDGITPMPARYYLVRLFAQPSGSGAAGSYTGWASVPGWSPYLFTTPVVPTSAAPLVISGLQTFTRYAFSVTASSPDAATPPSGRQSAAAGVIGITKSNAQGTWGISATGNGSNTKYSASVAVSLQAPTFPWTGTARTTLYRLTSPAQSITSGTSVGSIVWSSVGQPAQTLTDAPIASQGSPLANFYYAAVTSITPYGDGGGAQVAVSSCVLSPPVTNTSTGPMGQTW